MIISELETRLGYRCVQSAYNDAPLAAGYTSDLLSDVMAHAEEGSVLVTIQAHRNAIAVASMTGIAAMVVCNSRPLPDDMMEAARDEHIAVFLTDKNQFTVSGEIYGKISTQ